MKNYIYILLTILLLTLSMRAWSVEFTEGTPINLSVRTTATTASPGEMIRISASATDLDNEMDGRGMILRTVTDTVTLSWQASGGMLRKLSVGDNPVDLMWTAPLQTGYYAIFITASDSGKYAKDPAIKQIIEITVTRFNDVPQPALRVAVNPQTIQLDKGRTAAITAQIIGAGVAGKTINFFASAGSLAARSANTDANGMATVNISVDETNIGAIRIAAYYGNTTATTSLTVVAAPPPPNPGPLPGPNTAAFSLVVDPPTMPADGLSVALVTARLLDNRGIPIPQQTINFATTLGRIEPRGMTTLAGYAQVRLFASPVIGTGVITATVGNQQATAVVTFFMPPPPPPPPGPPQIFLTVDPTSVDADGKSVISIEALVLDDHSRVLVNVPVTFTTTLGTLKNVTVNTGADGRAATTLTAPDRPGLGVIAAYVGREQAVAQVTFKEIPKAIAGLDLKSWNGQLSGFVAGGLYYRQLMYAKGKEGFSTQSLTVMDAGGKVIKEIDLGAKKAVLIRDQRGVVKGYGAESDGKMKFTLLKGDGEAARTVSINLPTEYAVKEALYAEPAGHLVVTMAKADNSAPQIHFIGPAGGPLVQLTDLESMPIVALSGEGYLALGLSGGTIRRYNPTGTKYEDYGRTDGQKYTNLIFGPGSEWIAFSTAPKEEKDDAPKPVVGILSTQGTLQSSIKLDARQLAAAGSGGLMIGTADKTLYYSLTKKRQEWSIDGCFERFLASGEYGIIAGQRDPQNGALISRVSIVKLADGITAAAQDFADLREIRAILPLDDDENITVITQSYNLRFPLPEK